MACEHDASAWLELVLIPNISLRAKLTWLREFGSPGAVLAQSPAALKRSHPEGRNLTGLAAAKDIEGVANWIRTSGGKCSVLGEDGYPHALTEHLAEPPLAVFMRGNTELLSRPAIALIGGPEPTRTAQERARTIAHEIAQDEWLIAAGLSKGIAGAALNGALASAGPLAVGGSVSAWQGIQLAEEIAARGLLISEHPPCSSAPAKRASYASRHRLLAALAQSFVFIEASRNCETLELAALAGDIGREVMAVPADPANEAGRGCNRLLSEGARLIETSADILVGQNEY